jgi:hypothetical protein
MGLVTWVLLRFALAAPMTFEDGEFRLFESWALTRGHALQLLGMVLVIFLFLLLVELVIMVLFGISMLAVFGTMHFQPDQVMAFVQQPPSAWIGGAAALFLVLGLFWSVLIAAVHAVLFAPFAAFYRMLRPAPEAPAASPPPAVSLDPPILPDPPAPAPA